MEPISGALTMIIITVWYLFRVLWVSIYRITFAFNEYERYRKLAPYLVMLTGFSWDIDDYIEE